MNFILAFFCCFAASSGIVTINADATVQILAEEAVPLEKLDAQVHTRTYLFSRYQNTYMFIPFHYHICVSLLYKWISRQICIL